MVVAFYPGPVTLDLTAIVRKEDRDGDPVKIVIVP